MTNSLNAAHYCRHMILTLSLLLGLAVTSLAQSELQSDAERQWFRNVRQVTHKDMGLDRSGEAYLSPDGQKICFQAYPHGEDTYQIYVMNISGTGLKMISTGKGACTCSFFHPDGKRVLFASNHLDERLPDDAALIEKMRPREAGGHPGGKPAGHPGGKPPSPSGKKPTGHPTGATGGHPGGKPSSRGHSGGGYAWIYYPGMDIFEYNLETEKLQRLTTADGYDAEGNYSPDGTKIVFASFRDGDQEIYVADADGSSPRRVTYAKGKDGGPFFSPDGKRLCYRSDRNNSGNLQIFVSDVDGRNEKALTDNESLHWAPYWHPSGKWLIYAHADFTGRPNFDLYLIRDDGSESHRVTTLQAFDGLPVFSRDGRYLMWTSRRNGLDSPQIFIAEFIGLSPEGELLAKPE